jgi:SAM-dependent methyltransferase
MCREAAAREGVEVRLLHCDAREIDFDSEFDAVLNLWTSFGYLESDAEDQKVLDAVYRALKPGGAFLIEMINAYSLIARHVPRDWMETAEGVHVLIDRHFDTATSRHCERQAAIYPDGRRREIDIVLRLYTCPELTRMLEAAGLRAEAVFGDDWSALLAESRRMAVLARR